MNEHTTGAAGLAAGAAAWLALALGSPLLLHDFLLGFMTVEDPRLVEAVMGILSGAVAAAVVGRVVLMVNRVATLSRAGSISAFCVVSILSIHYPFPGALAIRFALLVVSVMVSLLAQKQGNANSFPDRHLLACACLLIAGSLWAQRESYYTWSAALATFVLAAATVSVVVLSVLEARVIVPEPGTGDKGARAPFRAPWAAATLALLLGTLPGLYMSLCKIVTENTALDSPATVITGINAGIIAGLGVMAIGGGRTAAARMKQALVDGPVGLIAGLAAVVGLVGLPWILGTTESIPDTVAGTWHVIAVACVPVLGTFMFSKLASIDATPGYLVFVPLLGATGFIIGCAGYLFGGTTYNMDWYIGGAFTILLGIGVIAAWTSRPHARERNTGVSIDALA